MKGNLDHRVLRASSVQRIDKPVLVDCGGGEGSITVVPIADGDRVAGLEVRCQCGNSVLIECVYGTEP
jgi:hypothetical protein